MLRSLLRKTNMFKRCSSTITLKPPLSKTYLHIPIPNDIFPKGYLLTGLHCGVKKNSEVLDLGIILSTTKKAAAAAACFTKNAFLAAPVVVSQEVLRRGGGRARAVVVNSGCANAVTGGKGLEHAWAMSNATSSLLASREPNEKDEAKDGLSETLVMSTGVIGQTLPIAKVLAGIKAQEQGRDTRTLGDNFAAWERAAKAFMTTDTFPKLRARTFQMGGRTYRMAGMDKGAGMIHPDMGPPPSQSISKIPHATLLGCIMTDAPISPWSLQNALTYAVERSFNSISVDGEMSTNDTILLLANGAGAVDGEKDVDEEGDAEAFGEFREALTEFAVELAQLVVRDGEGATKFVTVTVKNAATYEDAHKIASRISTSALVKTALYGEDANWGRILSAAGSVPLSHTLDPTRVSVTFLPTNGTAPLPVLVNGEPENMDEARAKEILSEVEFEVSIDLGMGREEARYWTCDFSYEYVRINGDYRS